MKRRDLDKDSSATLTGGRLCRVATTAYGILFGLTFVVINPWGATRDAVWTQPKVLVLFVVTLINLGLLWRSSETDRRGFSGPLTRPALVWLLFIAAGTVSTISSPFPLVSLTGFPMLGDGLLYWILVGVFCLSNAAVVYLHPHLMPVQVRGVLYAGLLFAASVIPQALDWRVDYTVTSGVVDPEQSNMLLSGIFRDQMPIAFTSHRGYASIVVVLCHVVALVRLLNTRSETYFTWSVLLVASVAVWLTQTRGALLALAVALIYVLGRVWGAPGLRKRVLAAVAITCMGGLIFGLLDANSLVRSRDLPSVRDVASVDELSSSRMTLWRVAGEMLRMRPIVGWGFDGYGIAWPFVVESISEKPRDMQLQAPIDRVTSIGENVFIYVDQDQEWHSAPIFQRKAHNLVLDSLTSVGVLGGLSLLLLYGSFFRIAAQSRVVALEVVAIAYIAYGMTWGDMAQYTHLAWWALSLGPGHARNS